MDSIGELGLGTGQFNQAADQALERLKSLGMEAVVLTGNLGATAAVIAGVLAKGIYDTRKQAEELRQTLQDIKNTNAFADDLVSIGNLESRIKSLNAEIEKLDKEGMGERIFRFISSAHLLGGKGFGASESERESTRANMAKMVEDSIQRIGKREEENLRVLQLQKEGRKEEADILKSNLDYNDKIAKAIEKGHAGVAVALAKEREISAELIKQKYLREQMAITSGIAAEEAKLAIDNELNDKKNQQIIKDREADKEQKKYDDEALRLANEELECQEDALEAAKKQTAEASKRAAFNKTVTEELKAQTREMGAARTGNQTAAKREAMENEYERKINEANRAGNPEAVAELEKQRNMERADLDVEESKKTPRERAEERKADRKRKSDQAKARARNEELERRAKNGARSAQIDDREGVANDQAERAGRVEKERQKGPAPAAKGFDETARKALEDIANAFRSSGTPAR